MQSTLSPSAPSVTLTSLAAFVDVPDPRRVASVCYPLPAIRAMAVARILSQHLSVLAISEWAVRQKAVTLTLLEFPTDCTPCQSTLQRLLTKLNGDALAAVLMTCLTSGTDSEVRELQGVAIEGKAQRGRLRFPGGAIRFTP